MMSEEEENVAEEMRSPNDMEAVKTGVEDMTMEDLEMFKKRLMEDERMDSIFRSKQNLTEKFDNRAFLHPHGLTDFDYKSIPVHRRYSFEKFKHKTRHENYKYLGEHYELDALLALFFKKLLNIKPHDPVHFAAEFFTRDTLAPNFQILLDEEKQKISNYRVRKMKAAEKITTTVIHEQKKVENEEVHYKRCSKKKTIEKNCVEPKKPEPVKPAEDQEPDKDANLNWLKKLNIGPLALDFDTRLLLAPPEVEITLPPTKKKKPKKPHYCGCKDIGRRHMSHPKRPSSEPKDVVNGEEIKKHVETESTPEHPDAEKKLPGKNKIRFKTEENARKSNNARTPKSEDTTEKDYSF